MHDSLHSFRTSSLGASNILYLSLCSESPPRLGPLSLLSTSMYPRTFPTVYVIRRLVFYPFFIYLSLNQLFNPSVCWEHFVVPDIGLISLYKHYSIHTFLWHRPYLSTRIILHTHSFHIRSFTYLLCVNNHCERENLLSGISDLMHCIIKEIKLNKVVKELGGHASVFWSHVVFSPPFSML